MHTALGSSNNIFSKRDTWMSFLQASTESAALEVIDYATSMSLSVLHNGLENCSKGSVESNPSVATIERFDILGAH